MNSFYNIRIPSLETKRLIIRPLGLDDAVAMYNNWASDERVTTYLTWKPHRSIDDTLEIIRIWMAECHNSPKITLGIVYKEENKLIGTINYFNVDMSFKEAEIGYCLAYDYWNQGIMSEALQEFIRFGINDLGFLKVKAKHDARNKASGKVMAKAGMKYISSSVRMISENIQLVNYALTKEEWLEELGYKKVFVIMDNNKEWLNLETLVNYLPYQNTLILTIKSDDYSKIEKDVETIKKYYQDDIIGCDNLPLEKMIINELLKRKWTISCAESCTGGMVIAKLINVSGSSNVINESYVTYSNEAKMRILGVNEETINKYSVASIEVAKEMVTGVCRISNSDVGIAVTGYAGASGNKVDDGVYYFAIKIKDTIYAERHQVFGDRNECRASQTRYILWRLKTLFNSQKSW